MTFCLRTLTSSRTAPSYVYDAVAFTRQMLSGKNIQYFSDMKDAINAGNAVRFAKYSNLFLETMRLIDEISAYDQDSLFGEWIGQDRQMVRR